MHKQIEDKLVEFLMTTLALNTSEPSLEQCMSLGVVAYQTFQLPLDVCTGATMRVVRAVAEAQGEIYVESVGRYVSKAEMATANLTVMTAREARETVMGENEARVPAFSN